jgi:hypothetical protein
MRGAGISAAVAATMTAASAASAASAGSAAAGGAATSGAAGSGFAALGVSKLVLLASLALGTVAVSTVIVTRPVTKATASALVPVPTAQRDEPTATSASTNDIPTLSIDELPAAKPLAPATPPRTRDEARATAPADPVAVEAKLLESARACLAAGDRPCAKARLAEHDARFATGALADEASVLAIDVALAGGDHAEARRLARALIARRPNGTWSSRVRRLANAEEETP